MTEYDLAFGFLQSFVQAAVAAAERGESIDDVREFRDFCDSAGVEPTPLRRELVRDAAEVVKECLVLTPDDAVSPYLLSPGLFSRRLAEVCEERGVPCADVMGPQQVVVDLVCERYRALLG